MVDKTRALSSTAAYDYQLWDGLKNQACVCDPGYSGVDCSERLCPKGADPLLDEIYASSTWNAVENEVQGVDIGSSSTGQIAAVVAGSTYALKYTDVFGEVWKTGAISAKDDVSNGGAAAVKAALEAIPNSVIESVTVTEATTASSEGVLYQVTFTHNPGNLNALEVVDANWTGAVSAVTEITAGTTVATECSGRGLCDYETGVCKCFRGYRLDDCSSQHALAFGSSGL